MTEGMNNSKDATQKGTIILRGARSSQLYASIGTTYFLAKEGHPPPVVGLKRRKGGTQGMILALITTLVAILLFAWYTMLNDPQTFVFLVATIILTWVVEAVWRGISKVKMEVIEVED